VTVGQGWSVDVDRDVCIGSGNCVLYAPGTFDQDGEAKAVVRADSAEDLATVRVAVEGCPTRALHLNVEEA
jgi:ferredoxin